MTGSPWLADTFAALMIMIAVYCVGRLTASRLWRRHTEVDADGLHAVMGVAMAGMLVPRLSPLPSSTWEVVFAIAAAWFAWQSARARFGSARDGWRCPHPVPHLVECGAMIYMLLAMPTWPHGNYGLSTSMAAMSMSPAAAGTFPVLAMVLVLFMLGYIVWILDRLTSMTRNKTAVTPRSPAGDHAGLPLLSDALAALSPRVPADVPGLSDAAATCQDSSVRGPMLAPRLAALYKIAMGVAMGYMLILMAY